MKQPKDNLVDAFEKFAETPKPIDPAVFENLAADGRAVPNVGYVRAYAEAENRGREIMDAAKRGERNFPPARQVVKP
jgi:hypothetical protein